jgi:hypothetical protein
VFYDEEWWCEKMPYCSMTEARLIGAYDATLASLRLLKTQTDDRTNADPQISHVG